MDVDSLKRGDLVWFVGQCQGKCWSRKNTDTFEGPAEFLRPDQLYTGWAYILYQGKIFDIPTDYLITEEKRLAMELAL